VTMPTGTTTASGAAFGQSYGGQLSNWENLGTGATETLDLHIPPTFTSSASATSIVGAPFSFTVSTTGEPVPAITESGALPAGLTFTDNANGTATIAGTAATGSGGSYPLTLTAANPSGSVTQAFTLTNNEAPAITSAPTASFAIGVAGTYTVTTHGFPAATITESGALPGGLSFTAGTGATAGTATIAGTPASGTAGTYPVTLSATNASGSTATLALTITVSTAAPPSITTAASVFFTMGQAGSFAVTASGAPVPTVAETGALPAGLTWVDQGNGTALLSGTPATTGTTTVSVTAANGQSPSATQTLTITVGQAAAITSAATTTFTVGAAGTFKVSTSGYPSPSLAESGALPSGVTFTDNHDGSATLAGTPAAGTAGAYPLTLTATNANGSMTQSFALDVDQAPVITSSTSASFTATTAGSFSVTATGLPVPSITETGPLPAGVTFKDNGNGTATLAGTPAAGSARTYPLTFTASNGAASTGTQSFMLTVTPGPGQFVALNPVRLLDSRIGTGSSGPVAPGATVHLTVHTPTDGVPASGVGAVVLNVTVTQPKAAGYLTVYPDGQSPQPVTSNLNFSAGQTVPNLVIAPVGADGKVAIYNGSGGTVQIVADISGWFSGN
jgi:large repetitive protein